MKKPLTIMSVLLLAACKKPVEVKQDTPEATMASLVKLYAAKEPDQRARVGEVFDSALLRARARETACSAENAIIRACDQRVSESLRRCTGPRYACPGIGEVCPRRETCACGTKGTDAAAKPVQFAGSELDKALGISGFDPLTCQVTDVQEKVGKDFGSINGFAYSHMCSDMTNEDRLALVTMACDGKKSWAFVLRETNGRWRVLGFDTMSDFGLRMTGTAVDEADKNKTKLERLNKDMK